MKFIINALSFLLFTMAFVLALMLPVNLSAKKPINTVIDVDPPTVVEQVVKTGTTLTIHYDHDDLFNHIIVAIVHTSDYADALTQLYIGVDEDGDGIIYIFGLERSGYYYIRLIALDKALELNLY